MAVSDMFTVADRRKLMGDIRKLHSSNQLDPKMLSRAKQRAADMGVTGTRFDEVMKREGISPTGTAEPALTGNDEEDKRNLLEYARRMQSEFTDEVLPTDTSGMEAGIKSYEDAAGTKPTSPSEPVMVGDDVEVKQDIHRYDLPKKKKPPEDTPPTVSPSMNAAQNVMLQREFGTGLGTLAAMQDPNYKVGSGSSLRQPARQIGTKSGAMRRASRRLRRQGYGEAAQKMAFAAEQARLGEPGIMNEAERARQMGQRIQAGQLAQQEQDFRKRSFDYVNRLLDKRMGEL